MPPDDDRAGEGLGRWGAAFAVAGMTIAAFVFIALPLAVLFFFWMMSRAAPPGGGD